MKTPTLSLIIDELRLEGLPGEEQRRLAPLIQQHLALLLARTPELASTLPRARHSVVAPTITLRTHERPERVSQKIATAIYQSIFPSQRGTKP